MDEPPAGVTYEDSRPSLRAIAAGAAIVIAGIALAIAVAAWVVWAGPAPANAPNNASPPEIRGPALETAPRGSLREYRREKAGASSGPDPTRGVAFEQRVGAALPAALRLDDEAGSPLRLGDALAGKPSVLLIGYLQCRDLCDVSLAGATEALREARLVAGRDYRGVFVSVDARDDALARAAARASRIAAAERDGWHFLGADAHAVAALANAAGFRYRSDDAGGFAHPAGLIVLTPRGTISRYFFGVRFDPQALRRALDDAGREATGGWAEHVLILCSHLDPLTGRYSDAILDALRALIALVAAAGAAWLWRARRKSRAA
jgi:protein SCO1